MGIQPEVEIGLDTKEIVLEIILDPPADLFSFFLILGVFFPFAPWPTIKNEDSSSLNTDIH